MTATTSTSIRTASGWTLALWTTIALVVAAGVAGAATAVLTDDGGPAPRVTLDAGTDRSTSAVADLVSPDATEHRLTAGGGTAVNSLPAVAGVFTADAAERWLAADADDRLDVCTSTVVAADAVEHCLTSPLSR
jgi:hypothetical protein